MKTLSEAKETKKAKKAEETEWKMGTGVASKTSESQEKLKISYQPTVCHKFHLSIHMSVPVYNPQDPQSCL